jgi:hypothetical protein
MESSEVGRLHCLCCRGCRGEGAVEGALLRYWRSTTPPLHTPMQPAPALLSLSSHVLCVFDISMARMSAFALGGQSLRWLSELLGVLHPHRDLTHMCG